MQVPPIAPRGVDSHKGTFGRAMIVAGSRGMAGAASLASYAAVRSGAGLVRAAVPDCILETVAGFDPCFMTTALPDHDGGVSEQAIEVLRPILDAVSSIGIGPGLGKSTGAAALTTFLYRDYSGPLIIDADAINVLATTLSDFGSTSGPRIFTPHIGEFHRLIREPSLAAEACRTHAKEFAKEHNVIMLLKGPKTLVTDGAQHYENTTGNPGMATGGCGDVLTGVLTALCGQDYSPLEATVLGAYIHGLAGDIAVEECGEVSLTAMDVAESLSSAFCTHASSSR